MVISDNIIYLAGAINVSKDKDENDKPIYKYDAGIVTYNTNGKYIGKYSLGNDTHHRFNAIVKDNDNLLLSGLTNVDNYREIGSSSFNAGFSSPANVGYMYNKIYKTI